MSSIRMAKSIHLIVLLCTGLAAMSQSSRAGNSGYDNWANQKCSLYRRAVNDAISILGPNGLRSNFLEQNERFIEDGCQEQGSVCPQSEKEIDFANLLTIMTMNEGMASTFVPFGCGG